MIKLANEGRFSVRTYKRNGDLLEPDVWSMVSDGKLCFGTFSFTHKVNRFRLVGSG